MLSRHAVCLLSQPAPRQAACFALFKGRFDTCFKPLHTSDRRLLWILAHAAMHAWLLTPALVA